MENNTRREHKSWLASKHKMVEILTRVRVSTIFALWPYVTQKVTEYEITRIIHSLTLPKYE